MRYTQKMVDLKAARLNKDTKIVHVSHRNDYYAVDNAKQNVCYECGMTTKECYHFLKGIEVGIDIKEGNEINQENQEKNYYDRELMVINLGIDPIKIKVMGLNNATKWMNLNSDCIKSLQRFLNKVLNKVLKNE